MGNISSGRIVGTFIDKREPTREAKNLIRLFLFADCFLARAINAPLTLFSERHE
jgi:hypothetical protein